MTEKTFEVSINLKKTSFKATTDYLEQVEKRTILSDFNTRNQIQRDFGIIFSENILDRFKKSPKPTDGGKVAEDTFWRPLKDAYLKERPDRMKGRILVDSGTLLNSFQVDSPSFVSEVNNDGEYIVGTRVGYAGRLNRIWPMIEINEEILEKLSKVYTKWIVKKDV